MSGAMVQLEMDRKARLTDAVISYGRAQFALGVASVKPDALEDARSAAQRSIDAGDALLRLLEQEATR